MPKLAKKAKLISAAVCNPELPLEHRFEMLRALATEPTPSNIGELKKILEMLSAASGESRYAEKIEQLDQLLQEMEDGPLRLATFVELFDEGDNQPLLARVQLEDGATAFLNLPDKDLAESLGIGRSVLVDRSGRVVLRRGPDVQNVGEEAKLLRILPERRVEVGLRGDERAVYRVAGPLHNKIDAGTATPGATLVVSQRQSFAFDALPPVDGLAHFEHLEKAAVPDVVAERDMGNPPRVIREVADHLRIEMMQPEIPRAYGLTRSCMHLLAGIPGSGKTMAILAIWNQVYQVVSELTGVAVDDLPPRVFKFRLSRILDPYFGVTDKNLDRFFDEVEQLAAEPFVTPDGKSFDLPVLVVLEEIDGLAGQRGRDQNGIYDRVLTTLLQRLDPIRSELRDKLIVFLGTTNHAGGVDAAFLRRIGGSIHKFGRLGRQGFTAVLDKHLRERPLAYGNGNLTESDRKRGMVSDLTAWLYSRNGSDPGIVELSFVGAAGGETRYRRHFLTGSLVGRAVQQACRSAAEAQLDSGGERSGVTIEQLAAAFDRQIRGIAGQIDERNAGRFLDLPDAARVASVRRLPVPAADPLLLQVR